MKKLDTLREVLKKVDGFAYQYKNCSAIDEMDIRSLKSAAFSIANLIDALEKTPSKKGKKCSSSKK